MLNKESWQKLFQNFISKFCPTGIYGHFGYYFNIAFPYKLINLSKTYHSKWITNGIKISSKKMHFFNSVKKKFSLSRQAQAYLQKYHITYKKVLKEAPKKEIMIGISKRQQTKTKDMAVNK